jgi:hypothetical protein
MSDTRDMTGNNQSQGQSQQQHQRRRRSSPPETLKLQTTSSPSPSPSAETTTISGNYPGSAAAALSPTSSKEKSKNKNKNNKFQQHPNFLPTISHLSRPLVPLVSITTGRPHPSFPRTILAYHLLTSEHLDDLARHYHQTWPPVPETFGYPMRIPAWIGRTPPDDEKEAPPQVDTETKRRRIGRFMGLRGCESPSPVKTEFYEESLSVSGMFASSSSSSSSSAAEMEEAGTDHDDDAAAAARLVVEEQMEKEWLEALRRARWELDPDAVLRRKAGGY